MNADLCLYIIVDTFKIHYKCSFIEDFPERQLSHIDVIVIFCTIMTLLMSTIHN